MTTIQLRRNTATGAAANNAILALGEPGWDETNGILKIGDGTTHWNDLPAILSGVYATQADDPMTARVTHGFLARLRHGEDGAILVAGDSTGDYSGGLTSGAVPVRWPVQLATLLAADWADHTVVWSQWLDASGSSTAATAAPFSWSAPQVVQAGPGGLRTDTVTASAASYVITDTSIVSGDAGKRVLGLNVPAHARVGTVTGGASFILVDESGSPVYPTGAVTSIQIGADPVISVWNASVSGSRWLYGFGQRSHQMYGVVRPHLIIANHGHNETNTVVTAPVNGKTVFRMDYLAGVEMLTDLCPGAAVILTGQNPRTDANAADEPVKSRLVADVATERGYGYVDVYGLFIAHGTWAADWMTDTLHPNTLGYAQWTAELYRMFQVPAHQRLAPSASPKSLFSLPPSEQLAPGGLLLDWTAAGGIIGWTTTLATLTKDTTTFAGVTCAKIVATSAGGFVQVPLDLAKVSGQWVTATIRARYDTGTDPFECGALAIHYYDVNGNAVKLSSSNPSLKSNGLRSGEGAWFYQSISAYIPDGATGAHVWLLGEQLGSATATYIRRLVVTRGRTPAGDIALPTPAQFVTGAVTDGFVSATAAVQPAKVSGLAPYLGTVVGASFDGSTGNAYSTPSATANRITGDIELRAAIGAGTSTRPAAGFATLIAKWASAGSQCYELVLNTSGTLTFSWADSGGTTHSATSTALAATLTADLWVRAQLTAATGAVVFATSPDKATWTTLTTIAGAGATTVFDSSTEVVEVGAAYRSTAQNFVGVIVAAEIASTLGGAAVAAWALPSAGASSWTASTGETWTLTGTVAAAYGVSKSLLTAADAVQVAGAAFDRAMIAAPAGAVAVTYDRMQIQSSNQGLPSSGTSLVCMLPITKPCTLSNVVFRTGGTAGAGTAGNVHQWAAVLDSTGKVLAVTTDKTLTAMSASTTFTWALVTPVAVAAGLYYVELCIVMDTTMPNMNGVACNANVDGDTPRTSGPASTTQTTPPAVGATRTLPTSATIKPYIRIT